ncbi:titin-like isoform X2 [Bradysia coprophila]|uniref:titin-like isoform X2 n=1 Tax=Bradysia coprophila TaxID=38358 RepID=UPI00187DA397|nr:titin-like isoform X2 [Bradysia coprophila]
MAVIRDVNLDTTSDNVIFIATIGGICLIVAVLGIKLRWFKHRMTFNELPTTSAPTATSNGMEPQIIRATFRPSSDFDNYVEITPPKVLPPVRIHKSARNAISLPPRKRQAPEIPTLRISETHDTNDSQEIEPLQARSSAVQLADNLFVQERRTSTPPPPLPHSPPPNDHQERLLLALEADYPYTESETIKIKEVHSNETILPSPPPYQESDPLAHIHFKKFTKKKHSSTPVPPIETAATSSLEHTDSPILRKRSVDLSPSPREIKLSKRHSFLNQVPTPTDIPKLAFDFPSVSTPNLSGALESNQPSVKDQPKSPKLNEKKSLLEYFGFKTGSKAENDVGKAKTEKSVVPSMPKSEKTLEAVAPKNEKKVEAVVPKNDQKAVPNAPIVKQKVKKIRVLKSDKKENVRKSETVKNERLATGNNVMKSTDNTRSDDKNVLVAQHIDPNEEILENRMEIDYFQKVKKSKANRVPIIVKSPKPEPKFEEKQPKSEVFRHEETFSAANGPLKVKKKKIKSMPQDTPVSNGVKPVEITNKDVNQNTSSTSNPVDAAPIPKPRAILKLDGFDADNRDMELKPKKKVVLPVVSSPSSPSDTEDAWNMVAKHRLNTRAITATAISVRQKSESDDANGHPLTLQTKQLEMLNKPKTMREMKREQEQRQDQILNFGGKDDKESDTEA